MTEVSVVIPVGPLPHHKEYLEQAIKSVEGQAHRVKQLLLIDDMAGIPNPHPYCKYTNVNVWTSPWRLGIAHAFNFGVMLAQTECVFMLGSDDWLEPACIQECVKAYEKQKDPDNAYYHVSLKLTDRPNVARYFSNAAMVTKELWKRCGGFPIEASLGAGDYLLSGILVEKEFDIVRVGTVEKPLYNFRIHENQTNAEGRPFGQDHIKFSEIQKILVDRWSQPSSWGRK